MINNYDKSTTITIGSSETKNSSATTNLISNNNNETSSNRESNPMKDGFDLIERNVIYIFGQLSYMIRERFQSSSTSGTIFAPAICFILVIIYFLNLLSSPRALSDLDRTTDDFHKTESIVSSSLTLVPGNILAPNYFFWSCISFFTYPFVEYHWYSVLNDIIIVCLCTNLIEPLFGRKELITFFLLNNTFVAFFTIVHYIMLYSLYGDAKYLYNVRLYGLSGYSAAVCVTVKQILPESVLLTTSFAKFKNNNVPLCALVLCWFFYLINFINGCLVLMFFYGLLVSWFYLRFIQYHPSNNLRGDLSPAFDFATFFPKALKPFVSSVCNAIYSVFVRLHIFENSHRQYQNLIKLSEKFSKEQSEVIIARHFKQHPSGDYNHLNHLNEKLIETTVQNM